MTRTELENRALSLLKLDTSAGETEARVRIRGHISEWYRRILARPGLRRLRDGSLTFDTVVGQKEYVLDVGLARMLTISEPTERVRLRRKLLAELRVLDPGNDYTGTPTHWVPISWGVTGTPANVRQLTIRLWPTPTAVRTYTVDYMRRIADLDAEEVPLLDDDYHWLLVQGAKVNEYERTSDPRLSLARDDLELGIKDMKAFVMNDPDYAPVAGESDMDSLPSRLGAWFPRGT